MQRARLLLAAIGLAPCIVWGAEPAPVPAAAAAASEPASAVRAAPGVDREGREPIEPNVRHIVIEGENTRVEELRVRGQTQSVVVTTKGGARYEMVIGDNSRDLSSGGGAQKGAAGQRVWRVLSF